MENLLNISKIPRESRFPVRLSGLFFCVNHRILSPRPGLKRSWFEVSLRFESAASICRDVYNGVPVMVPFPNIVWKLPGAQWLVGDSLPRNVISLCYPAEMLACFRQFDMVPEEKCLNFTETQTIRTMSQRLRNLSGTAAVGGLS